jgi:acetyltransferase
MGRLSEESRLRRFLAAKPRLTSSELRYLTEVDGYDHYAIVAVPVDRWDAPIVAVARFVRLLDEDPTTAEAAIVVADELQGKGLGKHLARAIADAARARGIQRIQASMLSDNPPALALMRVIGERLEDGGHEHGVHAVVAQLAAA